MDNVHCNVSQVDSSSLEEVHNLIINLKRQSELILAEFNTFKIENETFRKQNHELAVEVKALRTQNSEILQLLKCLVRPSEIVPADPNTMVEALSGKRTNLRTDKIKDGVPLQNVKTHAASHVSLPTKAKGAIPKLTAAHGPMRNEETRTGAVNHDSSANVVPLRNDIGTDNCSFLVDTPILNESAEWRTQGRRKQKSKNNKTKLIGTSNADIGIKAAPKYAYIHVFRLAIGTTSDAVKLHLNKYGINDCEVDKLEPKFPKKYTSFKITLPFSLLENINSPDIWPSDAIIQRFLFLRSKKAAAT